MRILFIINSFALGGAENLAKNMIIILKRIGYEVDALILSKNNKHAYELPSNVTAYYTNVESLYSPMQIFRIAKTINKKKYDLVHVHLFPAMYWFALAKMLISYKAPAVLTEHNTHNRRRSKQYLRAIEKIVYEKYAKIACVSHSAQDFLDTWLPSISHKTVTIHNGIELEQFYSSQSYKPDEIISNYRSSDKLLLMVASMTSKKDHETLIKSMLLLPANYHVLFVGEGPLKNDHMQSVNEKGLAGRVHFLGFRSDVHRIMKSADLFILSSHWEGFGLVAIEAMASNLPVIASRVPGLAEIVEGAGILFNAGDENELACYINEIMTDTAKYNNLIESGLKRAKQYNIDNMVQEYAKLYESLVE